MNSHAMCDIHWNIDDLLVKIFSMEEDSTEMHFPFLLCPFPYLLILSISSVLYPWASWFLHHFGDRTMIWNRHATWYEIQIPCKKQSNRRYHEFWAPLSYRRPVLPIFHIPIEPKDIADQVRKTVVLEHAMKRWRLSTNYSTLHSSDYRLLHFEAFRNRRYKIRCLLNLIVIQFLTVV